MDFLLIYNVSVTVLEESKNSHVEILWLKIMLFCMKIISLAVFYRPSNAQDSYFEAILIMLKTLLIVIMMLYY